MYDKDEDKRKRMKKMNNPHEINLHTLIIDGILEFVSSIKVIAVVRNTNFKLGKCTISIMLIRKRKMNLEANKA